MKALLGGCWIGELWGAFRNVSGGRGGHDYLEEVHETNATVSVLRCTKCGRYQIHWQAN